MKNPIENKNSQVNNNFSFFSPNTSMYNQQPSFQQSQISFLPQNNDIPGQKANHALAQEMFAPKN